MNYKKFILSIFLLFVVSNMLTTSWYMLMDDLNSVSFRRSEINYFGLMLNHLVFVVGFLYLFPYYLGRHNTLGGAFIYGLVMAAVMFIPTGLVVRSIWEVEINAIFLFNTLAHLLIGGVLGLIARFIYNYKKNDTY